MSTNLSEAESKVLEVCWRHQTPLTTEEVVAALDDDSNWSPGTIRIYLGRLFEKGILSATPDGHRFLYATQVQRKEYVHEQSRNLIDRLFGDSIAPFITNFSERADLSPDDIKELKLLIERPDHDR